MPQCSRHVGWVDNPETWYEMSLTWHGQLQCIEAAILQSTCSITNATCICTNPELIAASDACVTTSCNVTDQLSKKSLVHSSSVPALLYWQHCPVVAKIDELSCNRPVENYQGLLRTIALTFCILAEVCVLLRLWVKLGIMRTFGTDDWVIILAAVGPSQSYIITRKILINIARQHSIPCACSDMYV